MEKIYKYENCTVIVHIPDDDRFQERLCKASKTFMQKVISGGSKHVNSDTSRNFREK